MWGDFPQDGLCNRQCRVCNSVQAIATLSSKGNEHSGTEGVFLTNLKGNNHLPSCKRTEHMCHMGVPGGGDVTLPEVVTVGRIKTSGDLWSSQCEYSAVMTRKCTY